MANSKDTIKKKQKKTNRKVCGRHPGSCWLKRPRVSLLSNIIYGFGEINIKNRKGKTTARTIKKLVVKVRVVRGGGCFLPPRRGAQGGNPSAARLRLPHTRCRGTKGLARLTPTRRTRYNARTIM